MTRARPLARDATCRLRRLERRMSLRKRAEVGETKQGGTLVTVRIGVIGVGVMGADHARILSRDIAGVETRRGLRRRRRPSPRGGR